VTESQAPRRGSNGDDAQVATTTDARVEERPEPDQRLLRALADLDNLRKRYGRELERERGEERRRVANEWLPVVDDLERALEHATGESSALGAGVLAVYEHALAVLSQLGFDRFEDVGEPFDPRRHEALGAIESDAPPGTVAVTTRAGYGRDDEILRPATVLVTQGSP
jgi:molecular chaperone GrpE